MTERISFDVFASSLKETMHESFSEYLKAIEFCQTPEELLATQAEFVLFISRMYGDLSEIVSTAEYETEEDYH